MTFNVPSFFAGVGTVLGLLIVGFGGGVLMSGVVMDKGPRPPSKIEQHGAEVARPPIVAATPVPVAEAKDPAPVPQAEPQAPAPPQPQAQPTMIAAPSHVQTAPLGPQHPVALVNPAPEPRNAQHDARAKAREAKRAAEKKKAEQRKIAKRRRQQQNKEAQVSGATAERSKQQDLDDDDERAERPFFVRREDAFFRLFGTD